MRQKAAKPICRACHRPFDPSSPGATSTLGPTCAKRSGGAHLLGDSASQMSFLDGAASDDGWNTVTDPVPVYERRWLIERKGRAGLFPTAARNLPRSLHEQYVLAKIAFDELLREFHAEGCLYYDDEALALYEQLQARPIERHSFHDPALAWLEPEHDLSLLLDRESGQAYYLRIINGTYTLLEFDRCGTPEAKKHVAAIIAYSKALRAFREREEVHQLSIPGLDASLAGPEIAS